MLSKNEAKRQRDFRIALTQAGVSVTSIAEAAGVTRGAVYQTVWGRSSGARVIAAIREALPRFADRYLPDTSSVTNATCVCNKK